MSIVQQTIQIDYTESSPTVWYGCYDGGWQGLISEQAFSHPAKFSRNLISRIYAYALEKGYLKPGDVVLDPFGGVGLGALDAGANGLNWVGCELEKRFTDLGQGCDCTGISKADWVRFYGRWEKVNYKNNRHWCPQCLAQAKQVTIDQGQLSFFEPQPSAAYTRNSGIIPETKPHHYTGNLELFRKYAQPGTFAVLLNGDSRCLRGAIGQVVADGLLSSPPYGDITNIGERRDPNKAIEAEKRYRANHPELAKIRPKALEPYGDTPGQLGAMSTSGFDAAISSPPYIQALGHDSGHPRLDETEDKRRATEGSSRRNGYGNSQGQLSSLPEGNLNGILSSPPFAGNSGGRGEASRNGIDAALFDRHSGGMKRGTGDDPANLDHLPMKGFGEVLNGGLDTSPPFENCNNNIGAIGDTPGMRQQIHNSQKRDNSYGATEGQLGIEQGQTFWQAARIIVSESHLSLKPGAYTFWVCKKFVRDGRIVDFPNQWRQLCESVGFEYIETIRAMLVSPENEQGQIDGGSKTLRKERKSFFRRLAEKNGSPRIDFEEIVILRKRAR